MVDHNVRRLALKLFTSLDSPRSLTCFLMVKHGEWDQLVNLKADPKSYEVKYHNGIERYRRDIQATEFLRKCEGLPTSYNLEEVARRNFLTCEAQCRDTNARLNAHIDQPVFKTKLMWAAEARMEKAKSWLTRILGDLPDDLNGRFGPGATLESGKWKLSTGVTAYDKLHFSPSVTSSAATLADHLVWETSLAYCWGEALPNRCIPVVGGDRFAVAPKSAVTMRPLAIQPGVNMLGQLAIGSVLRDRLLGVGIDIRGDHENGRTPAQMLHRKLAKKASIDDEDATVDLSNASDTVALLAVRKVFPAHWVEVLEMFRTEYTDFSRQSPTEHPGYADNREGAFLKGWHGVWKDTGNTKPKRQTRMLKLEKFSAMGNGYTFELETLLFCAIAHSVGARIGVDTYIYGDDIIIPKVLVRDLIAMLRYMGFTPNYRKTFLEGHFRESCGGDFLCGVDVRPYYLKEIPTNASQWISVANGLWSVSQRWDVDFTVAARNNALDNVPSNIRRCRGPQALGDLVVHDSEEKWDYVVRSSIRYLRVWRPVTPLKDLYYRKKVRDCRFGPPKPGSYIWITTKRSKRYNRGVPYTAALMGIPSDGLAAPGKVSGYRFGRVAYS